MNINNKRPIYNAIRQNDPTYMQIRAIAWRKSGDLLKCSAHWHSANKRNISDSLQNWIQNNHRSLNELCAHRGTFLGTIALLSFQWKFSTKSKVGKYLKCVTLTERKREFVCEKERERPVQSLVFVFTNVFTNFAECTKIVLKGEMFYSSTIQTKSVTDFHTLIWKERKKDCLTLITYFVFIWNCHFLWKIPTVGALGFGK